jgi:hypothetical protein
MGELCQPLVELSVITLRFQFLRADRSVMTGAQNFDNLVKHEQEDKRFYGCVDVHLFTPFSLAHLTKRHEYIRFCLVKLIS